MGNRTTPFIKRMRVNGGTLFSFNSSIEDIGLNINEKNNVVKVSHFAVLDIPSIENSNDINENWFNVQAVTGAWKYYQDSGSIKDGRVLIAESFQNYASNLETVLLDQATYNPELQDTVSERVFWKWLKETGAVRFTTDGSSNWIEDNVADYKSVVKYVGLVSAGNIRRDTFGTYNETYLLIPTSHGQTNAYFKQVVDTNYDHGFSIGELTDKIEGRSSWLQPHPDGLSYDAFYDFVDSSISVGGYTMDVSSYNYTGSGWWYTAQSTDPVTGGNYYLTDTSTYIGDPSLYHSDLTYTGASGFSFRRSNVDCMGLELDLDNLKSIYGDNSLTFDTMATTHSVGTSYEYNAILIYYNVYNSTQDTVLATNLLGVMFLDAPSGNSSAIGSGGILLPSIEKIQSQSTGFGTSFSFRLNIKSDNTIDDTQATVVDYATSDQVYAEDFNDTMAELKKTIQILSQQTSTINYISEQYLGLNENQTIILNTLETNLDRISQVVNKIQDVSIGINEQWIDIHDVSIVSIQTYQEIQDNSIAGIVAADISFAYLDGSLLSRDASITDNLTSITAINAYQLIQDNSIATFEANDVTFAYVDGSLATRDAYIDASLISTNAYIDASLISRDVSIDAILSYQLIQDASIPTYGSFSQIGRMNTLGLNFEYDSSLSYDGSIFIANGFTTGITYGTQPVITNNPIDNLIDASAGSMTWDSSYNGLYVYDGAIWDSIKAPYLDISTGATDYTIVPTDHGRLLEITADASLTIPVSTSLEIGWSVQFSNNIDGGGIVAIMPDAADASGIIKHKGSSSNMPLMEVVWESAAIWWNGTNFILQGSIT